MGAIYSSYVESRREAGKRAAERIDFAWKRLKPTFDSLLPTMITESLCHQYAERRRKHDGVSNGTIHVELGYLRAALTYATNKKNWLIHVPYVPIPPKPAPKDHFLTKDEARTLIACASAEHVKLFITLALTTAGRSEAILDLTWDRVDMDRRKITLRDPVKHVTPKGRATVPINEFAFAALSKQRQGALTEYVIEWADRRIVSIKKGVRAAAARAGIKCSPHVLRHTAAVWMIEGGIPLEEISQYLGHTNIETTRRIYARYSPSFLRRASSFLEL
ncbi:integrase [Rhodoligotrophos appendicifer]|uniref:tyrosine-type recombinase/integrase n=1 Tax=Rhodoligotrophos appendicifer TaxID=987056 RepID=UPI001478D269|nr:site-specific integrase [Rhodoligotrophos appendicifer]